MTVQNSASRYMLVDVLRGVAVVLMVVYHFTFDLVYFNRLHIDFNHELFWLGLRALIVSLFLGLVGVSLYLAAHHGLDRARYLRRLAVLAGAAALVTAGSYLVFPRSFIFFGVLHFITLASVLGLLALRFYWANLAMGVLLVVLGLTAAHPAFDHPALQWFGLMTHKPITEDYVPLLPWFGVVLLGLFLGRTLYREPGPGWARWQSARLPFRALALGGRHSLLIYLAHQPLFFGMLYLVLG